MYEENARLEAHISDLESRKRAPLYQKRQEEELRAALEAAKEAEIKSAAAELELKEAKVHCFDFGEECCVMDRKGMTRWFG